MTFLVAGTTTCFLCGATIEASLGAGRLDYADPAEIGAVAKHGRPWVHRACWSTWEGRTAWARSAVSLLARAPGARETRGVVALPRGGWTHLIDPQLAFSLSVPSNALAVVRDALRTTTECELALGTTDWRFRREGTCLHLTAAQAGVIVEHIWLDDPDAFAELLEDAAGQP